jgi:hypothetical protein
MYNANSSIFVVRLCSIEILINYQKKKFYQKNRTYYVNLLQKKNLDEKYYLNFLPYKLLNEKKELLLLSGYENANIILCLDEKNKPIIFRSDNNGFRNYNNENHYDILLIGDSFVLLSSPSLSNIPLINNPLFPSIR